jgi:hypothetical protein
MPRDRRSGMSANTYEHWANCGVGSTVTTEDINEMTMDLGVLRNVVITKQTLLALDPNKASLETDVQGAANGAPFSEIFTSEVPAHPEPGEFRSSGGDENEGWEAIALSYDDLFRGAAPQESDETLEVAGRSLVCRKIHRATTLHGQPFSVTLWVSDQVPGGVVRSETRMGTGHVTKTTVTAFEKK